ncbi:hypothetical protein BV898_11285 [Hypsibius exemplaris]|uniref:Uncharacterized protein n=1 Tax=Hypsibius exemplaris TaxID=2072580 RepID=A0A1W0WH85_HYPEX|nr:hypothetical protein BV898_11285 [Hypsibius exemplaris]
MAACCCASSSSSVYSVEFLQQCKYGGLPCILVSCDDGETRGFPPSSSSGLEGLTRTHARPAVVCPVDVVFVCPVDVVFICPVDVVFICPVDVVFVRRDDLCVST